jgi:hypothetical protein
LERVASFRSLCCHYELRDLLRPHSKRAPNSLATTSIGGLHRWTCVTLGLANENWPLTGSALPNTAPGERNGFHRTHIRLSPDGGDGSLEAALFMVPIVLIAVAYYWRRKRRFAKED